ncbi:MAG: hypothetical protein IKI57_04670 [Clostridia bacterium]|nr:hypothetical protein [Clostridia bacterium]
MAEQEQNKMYKISFGDKNKRELMATLFSMSQSEIESFKMGDRDKLINLAKKAKILEGLDVDNSSIGGNVNPIGGLEDSQIEEMLTITIDLISKIKEEMPVEKSLNMSQIISLGYDYSTRNQEEKKYFEKLIPFGINIEEVEQEQEKENNLDEVPSGEVLADKDEKEKKLEEEKLDETKEELPPELNESEKEEDAKILATFTEEEKREYILKKYILSGEKLFQSIEQTEIYQKLPTEPNDIRGLVRDAYLTCTQPSDLMNEKFLDNFVKNKLNIQGDFSGLGSLHMAALGNTYVGYHIEEVGASKTKDAENNVAVISFPAFANDMPEFLKEEVRRRGKEYIEQRIKDVMNNHGSFEALALLSPFDDFIDSSLSGLEGQLGSSEEATSMKLYLKEMRSDIKGNIQGGMKNLDVTFNASDVNFKDRDQTMAFINRMRHLDREAGELNVDEAIREIASDYQINSLADAQRVVEIRRTLLTVCPNVDFDLSFGNMSSDERSAAYAYLSANGFNTPVIDNVIGNVAEEVIERTNPNRETSRRARREIESTVANSTMARLGVQVAANIATNAMAQQVVAAGMGVATGGAATIGAGTVMNAVVNAVNPGVSNDPESQLDSLSSAGQVPFSEMKEILDEAIEEENEFDEFNPDGGNSYPV